MKLAFLLFFGTAHAASPASCPPSPRMISFHPPGAVSGCYESSDCGSGESCVNGSCENDGSGWSCHSDMDCQIGESCSGGSCG